MLQRSLSSQRQKNHSASKHSSSTQRWIEWKGGRTKLEVSHLLLSFSLDSGTLLDFGRSNSPSQRRRYLLARVLPARQTLLCLPSDLAGYCKTAYLRLLIRGNDYLTCFLLLLVIFSTARVERESRGAQPSLGASKHNMGAAVVLDVEILEYSRERAVWCCDHHWRRVLSCVLDSRGIQGCGLTRRVHWSG